MKDFGYVIQNFFTHKDYLVSADLIPGTMYTPLSFIFEAVLLLTIITAAVYVSKHPKLIKPIFKHLWFVLLVWEVLIVAWDSTAGKAIAFDAANDLSLYPCSIFLYTLPFIIWGKGIFQKIAYGYICTLGLLGALVNFLYPVSRLTNYSCISFAGFHTFFFHGSMLFVFLVVMLSGLHSYKNVRHWWELFLPCVATLLVSIPANLVNYSHINADYMYFKGQFPIVAKIFGGLSEIKITLILYLLYIFIPALFYLPSYLAYKKRIRTICKYEPVQFLPNCSSEEHHFRKYLKERILRT